MSTAKTQTDFHPDIEAIFDEAQRHPVLTALDDRDYVILAVTAFETLLTATLSEASDISHKRVARGEKPDVVFITKATWDNLTEINTFMQA